MDQEYVIVLTFIKLPLFLLTENQTSAEVKCIMSEIEYLTLKYDYPNKYRSQYLRNRKNGCLF